MIGHIIAWSLRNKLFVVLAGVLLLAWGGWQAAKTPVDVFPDLTAPSVTVVTEAHGMAPTDVENLVTFPIETALNGAPGRAPRALGDQDRPVGRDGRVRVGHRPLHGPPGGGRAPATRARLAAAGHPGAGHDAGGLDHGRDPVHRPASDKHYGHGS